jgi:hypothetical protein
VIAPPRNRVGAAVAAALFRVRPCAIPPPGPSQARHSACLPPWHLVRHARPLPPAGPPLHLSRSPGIREYVCHTVFLITGAELWFSNLTRFSPVEVTFDHTKSTVRQRNQVSGATKTRAVHEC